VTAPSISGYTLLDGGMQLEITLFWKLSFCVG